MRYNKFIETAEFYDLDNKVKTDEELNFYKELINNTKGEALEIGCGTGRLTIPLAKSGIKITGFDISKPMLNIFKQKIENLSALIRGNISFFRANMTDFSFIKHFSFIFIPFSAFQALITEAEALRCLSNVIKHLTENGIFAIHVFKPSATLDKTWETIIEQEDIVFNDANENIAFKRTYINKKILVNNQIIYTDWFFYTYYAGRLKRRLVEHLKLKYYYEEQLQKLLEVTGFTVIDKFGYYDKRKIADRGASEMIFICKKRYK